MTTGGAPEWVEWVTAVGTAGAALFAGWATLVSARSARRTAEIVAIERARDIEAHEAERVAQASRVVADLTTQKFATADGREGADFHLQVANSSDKPLFKVRLEVTIGDGVWGPQLVGSMRPGQQIDLYGRIYTGAHQSNTDAAIRFLDAKGAYWVLSPRTGAGPDTRSTHEWVAAGSAFSQRELDTFERGKWEGVNLPEFDEWHSFVADVDGLEDDGA